MLNSQRVRERDGEEKRVYLKRLCSEMIIVMIRIQFVSPLVKRGNLTPSKNLSAMGEVKKLASRCNEAGSERISLGLDCEGGRC